MSWREGVAIGAVAWGVAVLTSSGWCPDTGVGRGVCDLVGMGTWARVDANLGS